ncbi:MAG: deoxyribose-phosphate aldolase [Phycisphaerales bacterium]|nr:deoxyribose-phosphate aldolase [Phycisphaerales bacterium]
MRTRTVDPVMAARRAAEFTSRSIKTETKASGLRLAIALTDLTTLEGADTPEKVRSLCRRAVMPSHHPTRTPIPHVAAVCVYPALVPTACAELVGSGVHVASVATAFPSGQAPLETRLSEVRAAVEAGADEIDMVVNRGALLSGDYDTFQSEIVQTKQACGKAHLKIILETGELGTLDTVRLASDLAIEAAASATASGSGLADGEVFIKTSTGKIQPAATMPVCLVMLEAIRDHFVATGERIGMKPAGGIRAAKAALHHLVMVRETLGVEWLDPRLYRFGASSLLDDLVRQILKLETGRYAATGDVPKS